MPAHEMSCTRASGGYVFVRLVLSVAALVWCLGGLQGCSTSPWEQNFVGASAPALPRGAPVQLREVQWDRLQNGLKEIEAKEAGSDVHPEDWPPEKKAAMKAQLLRTLQV